MTAMVGAGYRAWALNPMSVARYRQRHITSGSGSDPGDAKVPAELIRTDRQNHRPQGWRLFGSRGDQGVGQDAPKRHLAPATGGTCAALRAQGLLPRCTRCLWRRFRRAGRRFATPGVAEIRPARHALPELRERATRCSPAMRATGTWPTPLTNGLSAHFGDPPGLVPTTTSCAPATQDSSPSHTPAGQPLGGHPAHLPC